MEQPPPPPGSPDRDPPPPGPSAGAAVPAGLGRLWRSHARTVAAGALGALAGGAYAWFVGCHTGTCPITSNVWTASLYGLGVGAVAGWPARRR